MPKTFAVEPSFNDPFRPRLPRPQTLGEVLAASLAPQGKPQGSISARKRTLGEMVHDKAASVAQKRVGGMFANKLADLIDYTPIGVATQAFQIGQDARQSRYGQAGLNALATALNFAPVGKLGGAVAHSIIAPLWHGSPHKFEKFMLDKIGTGEGAQAYGHGLYFAEEKAVADEYRRALAAHPAQRYLDTNMNNADWALKDARRNVNTAEGLMHPDIVPVLEAYKAGKPIPVGGHLYKVKVDANSEDFLDWDRAFAEQPYGSALRSIGSIQGISAQNNLGEGARLGQWIESLQQKVGPSLARQELTDAGIPGIRYLDQVSRSSGNGTRNYVVFDPSLIDIIDRQ